MTKKIKLWLLDSLCTIQRKVIIEYLGIQLTVDFVQDADGSPIIVISENPLASPCKDEEIPDLDGDGGRRRRATLTQSKIIEETLEQCFNDENIAGLGQRYIGKRVN